MSVSVFSSALVGYGLQVPASGISAIWPASGVLLAILLLRRRRDWLVALIAAFVGNFAADVFHGIAPATAAAGSVFNAFESFVAASVIMRVVGGKVTFGTLRQVGALVIGAALVSNALTALLGALVLTGWTLNHLGRSWLVWWVGDGLGILVFTPVVVTIARLIKDRVRLRRGQWVEMSVILVAIAALTHGLLRGDPSTSGATASPVYAVFPLLIWAAVRQGPWAAASAVAVLSLVAMCNVAYTPDLFGHGGASDLRQVVHLYVYIALASISAIVPAAIMQERRIVESRLRTSERRFRQMAEHIREAFFVLDVGSRTPIYTSPTWATIWGRPLEDAADLGTWFAATHADNRGAILEAFENARDGHERAVVFRVIQPSGAIRWVRARVFPVRDDSGAIYRVTGICEDITTLRLTEDRLRRAEKMDALGRLAGGVAHDFNNLLTVIGGATDLLDTGLPPKHVMREDLGIIRQATANAAAMTKQLLAFSRQQPVQPQIVGLHALIEATGQMLGRLIGRHIAIGYELKAFDDTVRVDPHQIEQVLMNLAVNARDAMPGGGRLEITSRNAQFPDRTSHDRGAQAAGEYVCVCVRDTGRGMDAATCAQIFEPFFTTKEVGKGTGLGLATVYGIVQQSGGFITVESEPGRGTTIEFCLPIVGPQSEVRAAILPPSIADAG